MCIMGKGHVLDNSFECIVWIYSQETDRVGCLHQGIALCLYHCALSIIRLGLILLTATWLSSEYE